MKGQYSLGYIRSGMFVQKFYYFIVILYKQQRLLQRKIALIQNLETMNHKKFKKKKKSLGYPAGLVSRVQLLISGS